ncbi:MAG: PACE efflux transporter [Pseudomonadales bacterium]
MISLTPAKSTVEIGQRERLAHAVLFELILFFICWVIMLTVSDGSVAVATALVVSVSLTAMFCNYLFNVIFDRIYGEDRTSRTVALRIFHALCFEVTVLISTIPMFVFALDIGWLDALLFDLVFMLLALVYTYIFNWSFDQLRVRWIGPYPREPGSENYSV